MTLKQAIEGTIALGHDAFASELLAEIESANTAYWQTNSEALGEIYTHLGEYHARLGNFAAAHAALKKSQLLGTRVRHDNLIAEVSVAENGERQLTVNPEIEQMFEETRLLIQENQPSQETCAKLYSFLRRYGREGLKRPGGLQSAATALQIELQSRPDLQTRITAAVGCGGRTIGRGISHGRCRLSAAAEGKPPTDSPCTDGRHRALAGKDDHRWRPKEAARAA